MSHLPALVRYALQPAVLKTSIKTALLVGTLLGVINHYEHLLNGTLTRAEWIQILITYCVPFLVSSYAAGRYALDQEYRLRRQGLK